jgi:hypothetical protein
MIEYKRFSDFLKEKSKENISVVIEGTEYEVPKLIKDKLLELISLIGTIKDYSVKVSDTSK